MHKDKPPGPFAFAERSIRYLVGFWFSAGLILSILAHTGMLIWRADEKGVKQSPETLEVKASAHKPPSATNLPASAAVKY